MLHIIIHFPRCTGHTRKKLLLTSIGSRASLKLGMEEKAVQVILYESEFRSDTVQEGRDFFLIEITSSSPLDGERKQQLVDILKDEVFNFSGICNDCVTVIFRTPEEGTYFGTRNA